ncbi:MAG: ATP-binding protein [Myxococcales bacterium]|nr:ATP-binding protein [Myxococcales bacterium]
MYVDRLLRGSLERARSSFPAVLITGPRQSGKTTFLQHEARESQGYVSFDDPLERAFAREDPNGLLDRFRDRPVVLDEIQYVPELLPYLKMRIDRDRNRAGAYLLTGSQQFALMQGITESLAGRVAILELLPLSHLELAGASLDAMVWRGGYPDPALNPNIRDLWMTSYIRTYVERDVRQVRDIQELGNFERFLGLCAARHSQEFHAAPLARSCGVSQPTIHAWVSVLAASYVATLLQPWHRNLGKRLIRAPKLYLMDPGLVCTLTRQPTPDAALAGPLGGPLFEGLVVTEALKLFAAAGKPASCWCWRSHDGLEVDLVIEVGGRVIPVEAKLTATPTARHAEPLNRLRQWVGDEADPGLVVCRVNEPVALPGGATAIPWDHWPKWLSDRLGL